MADNLTPTPRAAGKPGENLSANAAGQPSPAKADAAPKPGATQVATGLIAALNAYWGKIAKSKGIISSPLSSTPSDSRSVTHDITTQLMETMEKQVDLSQERARHARFSHSCTRIFRTLALRPGSSRDETHIFKKEVVALHSK
jgi:hypothetical protein